MEQEGQPQQINPEEGVIGFFDILGFKNYIANDPDIRSQQALELILKAESEVRRRIKARCQDKRLDDVVWTVLSDTIVLSISYPTNDETDAQLEINGKAETWTSLLFSSVELMDYMFDQGLPLRGAVSYGRYFVHERCLAGKSITDARSLEQELDISAVAVCPEAGKELLKFINPEEAVKDSLGRTVLFPYCLPLKAKMQKMYVLNQWALSDRHTNSDIPQLVAQAFWKHGKDISEGAYVKLRNTEMLLRYIVAMKRNWR